MPRLKSLFVIGAVAYAVFTLVQKRMADAQVVDAGGWKPVDPT